MSADDSPAPSDISRQSSTEIHPSPTPKRRRGASRAAPSKRTRSSFTDDVPVDPDISFVGETQLSFGSSIPDSYEQEVDELVGPTPYAGTRAPAPGIFDDVAEKSEEEGEQPEVSQNTEVDLESSLEAISTPPRRRRSRRSLVVSRSTEKARAARANKKVEVEAEVVETKEEDVEPSTAESSIGVMAESMDIEPEVEMEIEMQESVDVTSEEEEVISGAQVMEGLRKALQLLEAARLAPGECREAENLLFEAFAKLRHRGHDDAALN